MTFQRTTRDAIASGNFAFSFLAVLLAAGALFTATQAYSHADDANARVRNLAVSGVVSSTANISLHEYTMAERPSFVQSGKVTLNVTNGGNLIHEMVLVRSASAGALPKVAVAGERSVGAIDEAAIAEADVIGETGNVAVGGTVSKVFTLTPGTYVMFCNIDTPDGAKMLNHFTHGMFATLTVL